MDIGALLLLMAVVLLVVLFVGQPMIGRRRRLPEGEHELSTLLAERERLLNVLQELDFDYSLGKIPAEDYPSQRAALVQKGADILRKLDELTQAAKPGGRQGTIDDRLEVRIAARRAAKSRRSGGTRLSDEELEERIARRRKSRTKKGSGFCPRCGKPVVRTDVFCPACGNRLN